MTESFLFFFFYCFSNFLNKKFKKKKKAGGGDSCETEFIFLIHTLLSIKIDLEKIQRKTLRPPPWTRREPEAKGRWSVSSKPKFDNKELK